MSNYVFYQRNLIKTVIENSKIFTILFLGAILFLSASITAQAVTFTVTDPSDNNNGVCDSNCTLREAIAAANAAPSDDVVEFNSSFNINGSIRLNGSEILIQNNGSLTINGKGVDISEINAGFESRIFRNDGATVTVNGVTLMWGKEVGANSGIGGAVLNSSSGTLIFNNSKLWLNSANEGGAIYNQASTLILNNTIVTDNNSVSGGGGIYNTGTLTLNNSTVAKNSTNQGGGIVNFGATTNLVNSTVNNNTATGNGGGVFNNGTLNLTASIISSNTSNENGGGVFSSDNQSAVNVINSTLSGNSSWISGGGIYNSNNSTVTTNSSTFSDNVSDSDNNGSGKGGGINNASGGAVNARNTIIGGNTDRSGNAPDFSGALFSNGYNLIENVLGIVISGTTTGNILGQSPHLLPLGNYGGPTRTHALQANSPAIDAANPENSAITDQRAVSRPQDGDLNNTSLPDIGAYERQLTTFLVTKTADTKDNNCDTDCSLREALDAAIASGIPTRENIINFSPAVFNQAQTITLALGEIQIKDSIISINGTGAGLLTISGNNTSRIFLISPSGTAVIKGLKITDGKVSANPNTGGGIYNDGGTLSLTEVNVSKNSATSGGGISSHGALLVSNSVINTNTAEFEGSAIITNGLMQMTNSTVNGNTGTAFNTIRSTGTTSIYGSDISGNSGGSAVTNDHGVLNLIDSTINANAGRGIRNIFGGNATINNSVIGNNAQGGIENIGTLNITKTIISGNLSGRGAGIVNVNGSVRLSNSTISNNSNSDLGGGIHNNGGLFTIENSTICGNTALAGGGISNSPGNTLTAINSTICNNTTTGYDGGGIDNSGTVNLTNVTIANNSAGRGGGGVTSTFGVFNSRNTIIADNKVNNSASDFRGTLNSQGYNLIGNTAGLTITGTTTGNILGHEPQLLPLGSYGGNTQTIALQPTSPAIDAGDPNNFPETDQRGISRPKDGDLNGSILPDIGAYERQVFSFTVTKTVDTNDNVCDADCSLREAIAAAAASPSLDKTIVFSPAIFNSPQTITLTNGELSIAQNNGTLFINGTGTSLLTISGNNQSRVFFINAGAAVAISDLTVTGGKAEAGNGGGIYNSLGLLTLKNVSVRNNSSNNGGGIKNSGGTLNVINSIINGNSTGSFGGGGINNDGTGDRPGSLIITGSTISGNTGGSGGGISNSYGNVTINNSTISDNATGTSWSGGGIYNSSGAVTINNSIISNNTASESGGGIRNGNSDSNLFTITDSVISDNRATIGGGIRSDGGTMTIINSNIKANTASFRGGGILTSGGTMNVTGSTISNNSAMDDGGGIANFATLNLSNTTISINSATDQGGGIHNGGNGTLNYSTISNNSARFGGGIFNDGLFDSRNTLIADNTASASAPDFYGVLTSQGYNLIENTSGATITGTTTGNIIGQDPLLAPLADNGGSTLTHALVSGSPAIDTANPSNPLATDQRGFTRPRDGDGNGTTRADIGAFELRTVMVANTNNGGAGSLRQAIADVVTQGDAVVFNANLFNTQQTINLTSGELIISGNINFTINGRGADKLTISGGNQSRVLYVNAGANVTINGVTITGGNGVGTFNSGNGGGVFNDGTLTFNNSTIRNNAATNRGGGIFNDSGGILTFINSTISHNTVNGAGGGIDSNVQATLNLTNSTVSNNSATGAGNLCGCGGGIINYSVMNLTSATIADNSAISTASGIFNVIGGTVNARNTIIADNNPTQDFFGPLNSQGYNLIENTSNTTISGITTGNILGVDPQLMPLGNYGGSTQTHALRPTSPAIDKGNSFGVTTDQRGQTRPFDNPTIPNAPGGNGSDIGAFERQPAKAFSTALFDFDGDGKSDISVFRPSAGSWYLLRSSSGSFFGQSFGLGTDIIVPADYDGDGKTDFAVFRPDSGNWYLQQSTSGFTGVQFGQNGDIPVPADYDGDGKADIGVYRPSTGGWYRLNSSNGQFVAVGFGTSEDKPTIGDFDGDGKADIAVFRPSTANWFRLSSSNNQFVAVQFGAADDKLTPADFDGDGKTDIAVYRPSTGGWYRLNSSNGEFVAVGFGTAEDKPVPADYDGDGKADIAVFRPSDGNWYLLRSTAGFTAVQFGQANDKPVPNAFVP